MGKEVERKFLLKGGGWRRLAKGVLYCQGYLSTVNERIVRVRAIGEEGFLTIKGVAAGATRSEYEYKIPVADAIEMLSNLCEKPLIEKNRYKIKAGPVTWEVDEFLGDNRDLIVAEVELRDEKQAVDLPTWIGREVTGEPRYYNSNLTKFPFTKWD